MTMEHCDTYKLAVLVEQMALTCSATSTDPDVARAHRDTFADAQRIADRHDACVDGFCKPTDQVVRLFASLSDSMEIG